MSLADLSDRPGGAGFSLRGLQPRRTVTVLGEPPQACQGSVFNRPLTLTVAAVTAYQHATPQTEPSLTVLSQNQ